VKTTTTLIAHKKFSKGWGQHWEGGKPSSGHTSFGNCRTK